METYETALLKIARLYAVSVAEHGGKSLRRLATIVANRGSFFDALEGGATCSARNLEKFIRHFAIADNWPLGLIPKEAEALLASVGRSAVVTTKEAA